uniref:Uncharacterized protein n=1 Tax=Acrobeloides nanus TaxID=290746 RepID=A0A914DYD4_9BILA
MSKVGQKKLKWKPKPRPPPEPILVPPQEEKKIWEILREEKISPTKRYVRKRRIHHEIIIPLIIPWEYLPTKESQAGMGAFGRIRDPNIRINNGNLMPKQGSLKSETVLPLFEETIKKQSYATDYIMWGSIRKNVGKVVDNHKYANETKQNISQCVIPRISLGSFRVFEDMIPFGNFRQQTIKITYIEGMTEGCTRLSDTFISRYFEPTNDEKAGSNVMNRRRNVVARLDNGHPIQHKHVSDSILPILFDSRPRNKKSGADFGTFRPTIFEFNEICFSSFDKELMKLSARDPSQGIII